MTTSPVMHYSRFSGSTSTEADDSIPIRSEQIIKGFVDKPGKVFLLYGNRIVFHLSLRMAAHAMMNGKSIAVVDGCNQFDVHSLSRFARRHRIDPTEFLNRIFISRGFTCYQMEQALTYRLPVFLKKIHSSTALVFGLLDTFYDEQASLREVQQILQRLLKSFQEMKLAGTSLLLVCLERTVAPKERNQLFTILKSGADRVYKIDSDKHGELQLFLEPQQTARTVSALNLITEGENNRGTNRTNLHQSNRCGAGKLVKVPPRASQRRSRSI
jgi:hypothetical protein